MELPLEYFILLLILIFFGTIVNIIQTIWKLLVHFFAPEKCDLKNKYGDWAVITGSTDGIGKEYAKELAKRDLNVVLVSRTLEKLKLVKNEIEEINPAVEVRVIQADFSKGKNELTRVEAELKNIPVGILVNNVGKMTDSLEYHDKISEDDVWDMITINDCATAKMTHMVIDQMKKRRKGAIINVSSATDLTPIPLQAVYAASKIFVTYFSDAIRLEYAKYGITVQCLSPFYINTKMLGFAPTVQNHFVIFPNAEKYVKSAIRTLGLLNSTSGYWIHDVLTSLVKLLPMWARMRFMLYFNRYLRYDYSRRQKENGE
ncbi:hydroxysteroid dehydrogenase-like protein 1 [Copidosoma floridanum]|uniref:hydroxysteroid dehydrogenase-like protein 1 n=1 Tax=Copidosoma floridanum TaxID=29053 RepID=UPI0006C98E01|nr:hydroxysteroid dehydrogenase-like protein 1 [Copidosoma floridanum]XP_014214447.1 hydroxysteroid dehydrogenase-like protein 1 [Copidosoma floridanum]